MSWGRQAKDNVAPGSEEGREEDYARADDAPRSPILEGFDVLPEVSDVLLGGEGLRFALNKSQLLSKRAGLFVTKHTAFQSSRFTFPCSHAGTVTQPAGFVKLGAGEGRGTAGERQGNYRGKAGELQGKGRG